VDIVVEEAQALLVATAVEAVPLMAHHKASRFHRESADQVNSSNNTTKIQHHAVAIKDIVNPIWSMSTSQDGYHPTLQQTMTAESVFSNSGSYAKHKEFKKKRLTPLASQRRKPSEFARCVFVPLYDGYTITSWRRSVAIAFSSSCFFDNLNAWSWSLAELYLSAGNPPVCNSR
jgi:hypothetical protein